MKNMTGRGDHHCHPERFKTLKPMSFLLYQFGVIRDLLPVCEECIDRAIEYVIDVGMDGRNSVEMHDLFRVFLAGVAAGGAGLIKVGRMPLPTSASEEKVAEAMEEFFENLGGKKEEN